MRNRQERSLTKQQEALYRKNERDKGNILDKFPPRSNHCQRALLTRSEPHDPSRHRQVQPGSPNERNDRHSAFRPHYSALRPSLRTRPCSAPDVTTLENLPSRTSLSLPNDRRAYQNDMTRIPPRNRHYALLSALSFHLSLSF